MIPEELDHQVEDLALGLPDLLWVSPKFFCCLSFNFEGHIRIHSSEFSTRLVGRVLSGKCLTDFVNFKLAELRFYQWSRGLDARLHFLFVFLTLMSSWYFMKENGDSRKTRNNFSVSSKSEASSKSLQEPNLLRKKCTPLGSIFLCRSLCSRRRPCNENFLHFR